MSIILIIFGEGKAEEVEEVEEDNNEEGDEDNNEEERGELLLVFKGLLLIQTGE